MVFKNPAMKKILKKGGRRITLYTDVDLQNWLDKISQTKKPRDCGDEEAFAIMTLLWYTGARSSELVLLEPEHMYPLMVENKVLGIAITLRTLKRGEDYRKISIPYNEITKKMYKWVLNQAPESLLFWHFLSRQSIRKISWINHKIIYVREKNREELLPEEHDEVKTKSYEMNNKKLNHFVNNLTGLPPLYFRHHRLSWMAKLGATLLQMQEFKGSKDFRSVTPYLQLGAAAEKEFLEFFP